MRRPSPIRQILLLAALVISASPQAWADVAQGSLLHFRAGMIGGSVSSQTYGSTLSLPGALDLEYEFLLSHRRSTYLRATLGYELSSARMPYSAIMTGLRFDIAGSARAREYTASGSGSDYLERTPRFRLYAGGDLGISHITVQRLGPVLEVNSTLVEFGGSMGAVWQVGKKVGVELCGAAGLGLGFANVSASARLYRIFLGMSLQL